MNLHRQRGVALITVLLVFALVAIIATNILQRSQLNLRSVGGLIDTRQTYYYALAGEAYARQILARDKPATDTLLEPWAQTKEQQPFQIDNGTMQVEIHDLQGRFNLNNIATADASARETAVKQFRDLLTALQLDVNYANALRDWLDTDQTVSTGGAEDAGYAGYLTANEDEADISALRLLHSMQPEGYAKLAPHVTVLPASDTTLNINTADAEVLSTIMSGPQAAQVVARQQGGGYNNIADAPVRPQLSNDLASVSSSYFEVVVTVNYANRWQRIRTVLQRTTNQGPVTLKVLSRVRSPLIDDSE